MTTIICISDLHGKLPKAIPACDVLVIAGDICPSFHGSINLNIELQMRWLRWDFTEWLKKQPVGRTVACWGNHDWIGYREPALAADMPWDMLTDQAVTIDGLKFYGSPWSLPFFDWAFMRTEEELAAKYAAIPDDTDVLISHGPPYGYGDLAIEKGNVVSVGSPALTARINEIKPVLTVFGHIHGGAGAYWAGDKQLLINASLLNENYEMVNTPYFAMFYDKKIYAWGPCE